MQHLESPFCHIQELFMYPDVNEIISSQKLVGNSNKMTIAILGRLLYSLDSTTTLRHLSYE